MLEKTARHGQESQGLTLRKELAAEIGAGSSTVKIANESPRALAG